MIDNETMRRIEKGLFSCNSDANLELSNLLKEISDTLDWIVDLSHRLVDGMGKEHRDEISVIQRMLDELYVLRRKPS